MFNMLCVSNKLIMLSFVIQSVVMLNDVMLSVVSPFYKCNFEVLSKLGWLKNNVLVAKQLQE